jgi:hypothetical protein
MTCKEHSGFYFLKLSVYIFAHFSTGLFFHVGLWAFFIYYDMDMSKFLKLMEPFVVTDMVSREHLIFWLAHGRASV